MAHIDFKKAIIYSSIVAGLAVMPAYAKYKEAAENMVTQITSAQQKDIQKQVDKALEAFTKFVIEGGNREEAGGSIKKAYKLSADNKIPNPLLQGHNLFLELRDAYIAKTGEPTANPSKFLDAIEEARAGVITNPKAINDKYGDAFATAMKKYASATIPAKTRAGISEGEAVWTSEYYPAVTISSSSLAFKSAYDGATVLPSGAAGALLAYSNTANECNVAGPDEKKTISTTAVMLYGVDPSLLPKYFAAAENLAKLCRNQPNEYRKSLDLLAVMIDTKTGAIYSANVSAQLPVGKTARQISNALNEVRALSGEDIYRLNRLSLMDRNVYISSYPPYEIHQRPSGWRPSLLEGNRESAALYNPSYMFPNRIYLPVNLPRSKSMVGTDIRGGGTVRFPNIPLNYWVQPWAGSVETSFKNYLYPQHRVGGAYGSLPVTPIAPTGVSGLADKIRAAFVQTEAPDYDLKMKGFGAYASADNASGGGGVGSYATKSGGIASGFGLAPGGEPNFAGLNMVAVPLVTGKAAVSGDVKPNTVISAYDAGSSEFKASIRAAWKAAYNQSKEPADKTLKDAISLTYSSSKNSPADAAFWKGMRQAMKSTETGASPVKAAIENLTVGWEKMDDGTKNALLQSVSSIYDPKNPKDIVLLASSSADGTGEWSAGKAYLITKDRQAFELAGGSSTFSQLLNYVAGYGNDKQVFPKTYAWNVENKLKKGGAVLAMDLGSVPVLFQFQDVPRFTGSGQKLVTWTAAGGWTNVPKEGQATINEISLPGTLYQVSGGKVTSQHLNYTLRHLEKEKRWEFDAGGTAGNSTLGRERKAFQGAGFLMKWEAGQMNRRMVQRGFGLSTERLGGDALQLAGDAATEVNSLYRISTTLYGTNSPAASDMMVGGLVHVVEQLKGEVGNERYDATLFRLVGFLSGLKNHGMLDVTRASWIDRMLGDYDDLRRNAGENPQNLETMISQFQNNYLGNVKTLIDDYYLGVQLNSDYSAEFSMQSREKGDNWTKQKVERGAGRMLYTFDGGFVRGYCMMPMINTLTPIESVTGAGAGFDLFNSVWLPRLAFDAGIVTVSEQQRVGGFGQAAVTAYSNILEDASAYRTLASDFELAREGKFSKLSRKEREDVLSKVKMPAQGEEAPQDLKDATSALKEGRNIRDISAIPDQVFQAIDSWFADEKANLQKKFNGHTLVYSGASLYGLGHGQFYGDIGAFVEYADRLKSYVIVASREKDVTVYAGTEYSFDKAHSLGVIIGANPKGVSGGISFSVPVFEGIMSAYGIRTSGGVMPYMPPFATPYEFSTANDWVFGIVWTWGANPLRPTQMREIQPRFGRQPGTTQGY